MAEHLWLALLISTLTYHCIALDDSFSAIVGFSQSTYEAIGDTMNITVLVLNGNLMEEVNLSVVANHSGPGNISFRPSESFSLSPSSNISLTISIDPPPVEDLTFSIHLMKEEEMVMGSGDMGSGADMIMPYTVSLSPNTALVTLRVASISSRTPSPSSPIPSSSPAATASSDATSSITPSSLFPLSPHTSKTSSLQSTPSLSIPTSEAVTNISLPSLPPSSSSPSPSPFINNGSSEGDSGVVAMAIAVAAVLVVLIAGITVIIATIFCIHQRRKRRGSINFYDTQIQLSRNDAYGIVHGKHPLGKKDKQLSTEFHNHQHSSNGQGGRQAGQRDPVNCQPEYEVVGAATCNGSTSVGQEPLYEDMDVGMRYENLGQHLVATASRM